MRQIIALNEKLLAQRAALASEARLSALIENASDAILILDTSTTISYASPSVSKLLGTGPEQVLGSRLTALLHPDERDGALGLIAQRLSEPGSTATMTWRLRHSDAHWMPMEIVLTNMLGNPVVAGLGNRYRNGRRGAARRFDRRASNPAVARVVADPGT